MPFVRHSRRSACFLLGWLFATAANAEALKPSAAEAIEQNKAFVTSALHEVIASSETAEGELLEGLVEEDVAGWGIRYRDGHLLFSIPVRRNLTLLQKKAGESEAKNLALVTLAQKFNRLLKLDDASRGLDPSAVRVIFLEPDALRPCPPRSTSQGFGGHGWQAGHAGFVNAPIWAGPPSCGCR
jgi:hypothetical protein